MKSVTDSPGAGSLEAVAPEELPRALELSGLVHELVLGAGFDRCEIDPEGYRAGRLSEHLLEERDR